MNSEAGSKDPLSLSGVIPPTVTAFHDDESVDYETTAAHARFVVDRGAHGVFPLGSNGEFVMLTDDERARVVEAVVSEIGGDGPVIAGVGAPSTHRTVENAKRAAKAGADGLVVVTPYYYPIDHEGTIEHYRRVAEATSLPIYLYHIPSHAGNTLAPDTLAELAGVDAIVGLKDSSKDVPWLAQAIDAHPELTFLMGTDSLQLPGRLIGCSGGVSAVANAFPELVCDLHDAFDAGEEERAGDLQSTLYRVRGAFKSGSYISGVKSALSLRGLDTGPLRNPLHRMSAEEEDALGAELRNLDVV